MDHDKETWIVFLDIDGVIVTAESGFNSSGAILNQSSIYWLNKLLEQYDFQIVISSTWREIHTLYELAEILQEINAKIISKTPVLETRGQEIRNWLETNTRSNNYIVIDDEIEDIIHYIDDIHIVHVEEGFVENGFSKEHFSLAVRAIKKIVNT